MAENKRVKGFRLMESTQEKIDWLCSHRTKSKSHVVDEAISDYYRTVRGESVASHVAKTNDLINDALDSLERIEEKICSRRE